ncbi:MAG: hypothetical protein EA360_00840 [Balneolaceae bacterium]|nr:MAG: hypothetical protein EA360_00840 [Balneolaceae bacterium]
MRRKSGSSVSIGIELFESIVIFKTDRICSYFSEQGTFFSKRSIEYRFRSIIQIFCRQQHLVLSISIELT